MAVNGRVTIAGVAMTVARLEERVTNMCDRHEEHIRSLTNEIRSLHTSIDTAMDDVRGIMDEHIRYHENNEHLWGVFAWLKRKPIVIFILGAVILPPLGFSGIQLLKRVVALILGTF